MLQSFVCLKDQIINTEAIRYVVWIDDEMSVYQIGSEDPVVFFEEQAHSLWQHLKRRAYNLAPAETLSAASS
jgi:hypothetical protein